MAEPWILKQFASASDLCLQFYRTEQKEKKRKTLRFTNRIVIISRSRAIFRPKYTSLLFFPIYPATVGACPVLGGIINARQVGTPQQRGLSTVLRPWHYYLFIASLCCLYCCCGSRDRMVNVDRVSLPLSLSLSRPRAFLSLSLSPSLLSRFTSPVFSRHTIENT